MGSLKTVQSATRPVEPIASPRISFSADFLDEKNYISISPKPQAQQKEHRTEKDKSRNADFEFLSSDLTSETMLTAEELFFEGKLLPFRQTQYSEKLDKISLDTNQLIGKGEDKAEVNNKEEPRISWFLDDDPSPRPPKCTVLWKELLRLKKQRASTMSPSSSTSSSSSLSSGSIGDQADESKKGKAQREKNVRRVKKGLERSRSGGLKIRPMVNLPICTQGKNIASIPPLLSLRKGRSAEM